MLAGDYFVVVYISVYVCGSVRTTAYYCGFDSCLLVLAGCGASGAGENERGESTAERRAQSSQQQLQHPPDAPDYTDAASKSPRPRSQTRKQFRKWKFGGKQQQITRWFQRRASGSQTVHGPRARLRRRRRERAGVVSLGGGAVAIAAAG